MMVAISCFAMSCALFSRVVWISTAWFAPAKSLGLSGRICMFLPSVGFAHFLSPFPPEKISSC